MTVSAVGVSFGGGVLSSAWRRGWDWADQGREGGEHCDWHGRSGIAQCAAELLGPAA